MEKCVLQKGLIGVALLGIVEGHGGVVPVVQTAQLFAHRGKGTDALSQHTGEKSPCGLCQTEGNNAIDYSTQVDIRSQEVFNFVRCQYNALEEYKMWGMTVEVQKKMRYAEKLMQKLYTKGGQAKLPHVASSLSPILQDWESILTDGHLQKGVRTRSFAQSKTVHTQNICARIKSAAAYSSWTEGRPSSGAIEALQQQISEFYQEHWTQAIQKSAAKNVKDPYKSCLDQWKTLGDKMKAGKMPSRREKKYWRLQKQADAALMLQLQFQDPELHNKVFEPIEVVGEQKNVRQNSMSPQPRGEEPQPRDEEWKEDKGGNNNDSVRGGETTEPPLDRTPSCGTTLQVPEFNIGSTSPPQAGGSFFPNCGGGGNPFADINIPNPKSGNDPQSGGLPPINPVERKELAEQLEADKIAIPQIMQHAQEEAAMYKESKKQLQKIFEDVEKDRALIEADTVTPQLKELNEMKSKVEKEEQIDMQELQQFKADLAEFNRAFRQRIQEEQIAQQMIAEDQKAIQIAQQQQQEAQKVLQQKEDAYLQQEREQEKYDIAQAEEFIQQEEQQRQAEERQLQQRQLQQRQLQQRQQQQQQQQNQQKQPQPPVLVQQQPQQQPQQQRQEEEQQNQQQQQQQQQQNQQKQPQPPVLVQQQPQQQPQQQRQEEEQQNQQQQQQQQQQNQQQPQHQQPPVLIQQNNPLAQQQPLQQRPAQSEPVLRSREPEWQRWIAARPFLHKTVVHVLQALQKEYEKEVCVDVSVGKGASSVVAQKEPECKAGQELWIDMYLVASVWYKCQSTYFSREHFKREQDCMRLFWLPELQKACTMYYPDGESAFQRVTEHISAERRQTFAQAAEAICQVWTEADFERSQGHIWNFKRRKEVAEALRTYGLRKSARQGLHKGSVRQSQEAAAAA